MAEELPGIADTPGQVVAKVFGAFVLVPCLASLAFFVLGITLRLCWIGFVAGWQLIP